jgi:hypothetical protein
MTVPPEERDEMARLLSIIGGQPLPADRSAGSRNPQRTSSDIELAGPGQVTRADIDAMSSVLEKLKTVSNYVVNQMITESSTHAEVAEALHTTRTDNGVKVGRYQIMIKSDPKRLAGKQFYSIYNSLTNDVIADDISLYETALGVIRLLNSGKYANSHEVMKLFEHDDAYTSHRVDALIFKQKINKVSDLSKREIYESRYQASLDRCMAAKRTIKSLVK